MGKIGLIGRLETFPLLTGAGTRVTFTIGVKPKALRKKIFVTLSPAQFRQMQKYLSSPKPRFAPRASWHVRSREKEIEWLSFFPFGESNAGLLKGAPLRTGIGTKVHSAITEHLAAVFPRYVIYHRSFVHPRACRTPQRNGNQPTASLCN